MSRKNKYKCQYNYENSFPNFYMLMIVVLIVLQWLRTDARASGTLPEPNLVNNGGLFIITLFFLIACSCEASRKSCGAYSKYY